MFIGTRLFGTDLKRVKTHPQNSTVLTLKSCWPKRWWLRLNQLHTQITTLSSHREVCSSELHIPNRFQNGAHEICRCCLCVRSLRHAWLPGAPSTSRLETPKVPDIACHIHSKNRKRCPIHSWRMLEGIGFSIILIHFPLSNCILVLLYGCGSSAGLPGRSFATWWGSRFWLIHDPQP